MEAKHQQIRRALIRRIEEGELEPGARVPTEHELCEAYGVSRTTAGRVMSDLVNDGYITRKRGVGSTVATRRTQLDLMTFADPDSATAGHPGVHEVLDQGVVNAEDATPALPDLGPEDPIIFLVRRKLNQAGNPVSIERHALPFAVAPKLLVQELGSLVSIRYLRETGVRVASIRVYLIPHALDREDADLLDSAPGETTLIRRRELRDHEGRLIEAVETTVRPGTTDFYLQVPGPDA